MSETIAVVIPSRSRPESLDKAARSVFATSTDALVVAYVDADQVEDYRAKLTVTADFIGETRPGSDIIPTGTINPGATPTMIVFHGVRRGPVHSLNMVWLWFSGAMKQRFPNVRIFVYSTDDSTIGPAGWDQWLIKTIDGFPNRIGVVSASHGGGAPYLNFACMSDETCHVMGGLMAPSCFYAWYWDTALEILGASTRIVYAKPTEFEIQHDYQPSTPSSVPSDTDLHAFHRWLLTPRRELTEKLQEAMRA